MRYYFYLYCLREINKGQIRALINGAKEIISSMTKDTKLERLPEIRD